MTTDSIERSIDIDASAETVFALVSEGGWWINDGTIEEQDRTVEGDITTVRHPKHGQFQLRTVEAEPPRYVAFRWLDQDQPADRELSTLVEFFVEDTADGVTLRVVESGFATLPVEGRDERYAEHTEGWGIELEAAKKHVG